MLAMGTIAPKKKASGAVAYWKLTGAVARVRIALKAQMGRIDAEANHTVMRGLGGFSHRMRICESYSHP